MLLSTPDAPGVGGGGRRRRRDEVRAYRPAHSLRTSLFGAGGSGHSVKKRERRALLTPTNGPSLTSTPSLALPPRSHTAGMTCAARACPVVSHLPSHFSRSDSPRITLSPLSGLHSHARYQRRPRPHGRGHSHRQWRDGSGRDGGGRADHDGWAAPAGQPRRGRDARGPGGRPGPAGRRPGAGRPGRAAAVRVRGRPAGDRGGAAVRELRR